MKDSSIDHFAERICTFVKNGGSDWSVELDGKSSATG